jgi:hypothetical protein
MIVVGYSRMIGPTKAHNLVIAKMMHKKPRPYSMRVKKCGLL